MLKLYTLQRRTLKICLPQTCRLKRGMLQTRASQTRTFDKRTFEKRTL